MEFDSIHPITVSSDQVEACSMVIRTAHVLAHGLALLYHNLRKVERNLIQTFEKKRGVGVRTIVLGRSSELEAVPLEVIECSFRWYAVSLCDFVRCAATLGNFDKKSRENYSEAVLKEVQAFRDKVGAHTAGLTQNSNDNDAERSFTPCVQISWNSDCFVAGGFGMRVKRSSKVSDTSSLKQWSLTKFHEELCMRYPLLAQLTPSTSTSPQPEGSKQPSSA
jgi:hypothetical protein